MDALLLCRYVQLTTIYFFYSVFYFNYFEAFHGIILTWIKEALLSFFFFLQSQFVYIVIGLLFLFFVLFSFYINQKMKE